MSALIVDTSSWISYFAGRYRNEPLIEDALADGRVYLPPIVAAELLSGVRSVKQKRELENFLADLPLCDTALSHWFRVGALRSTLQARGLTISTPDAHIAQCAIDKHGVLLSNDHVFKRIADKAGLKIST